MAGSRLDDHVAAVPPVASFCSTGSIEQSAQRRRAVAAARELCAPDMRTAAFKGPTGGIVSSFA